MKKNLAGNFCKTVCARRHKHFLGMSGREQYFLVLKVNKGPTIFGTKFTLVNKLEKYVVCLLITV